MTPNARIAMRPTCTDDADATRHAAWQGAWAKLGREGRWMWWGRLSWAVQVSSYRAQRDVERWASRVRHQVPAACLLVGYHVAPGGGRRHAHFLLYLPRHGAPPGAGQAALPGVARTWLAWPHGQLWLAPYRPNAVGRSRQPGRGAGWYLSSDPGTVELYGQPEPYRPRRRRRARH